MYFRKPKSLLKKLLMENENNPLTETVDQEVAAVEEIQINPDKLNLYMEKIKLEQNLAMGFLGGLAAAVIGAIVWAVITVVTEYQIGYMAIAIGFLVGFSVRTFGKGINTIFGVIGAVLALIGCLLGNFLSLVGFFADAEGMSYLEILSQIDYALVPEIMIETFNPMDVLFYGIALYEGYKFSFRQITEEEILENAVD